MYTMVEVGKPEEIPEIEVLPIENPVPAKEPAKPVRTPAKEPAPA